VCSCGDAEQGATTRNSYSIPRSCNAAMCRRKRAIRLVAQFTLQVNKYIESIGLHNSNLTSEWSGQLRILGSSIPGVQGPVSGRVHSLYQGAQEARASAIPMIAGGFLSSPAPAPIPRVYPKTMLSQAAGSQ